MTANSDPDAKSTDLVSDDPAANGAASSGDRVKPEPPAEVGGRGGLDPTRYGDWEKNGRCIDF